MTAAERARAEREAQHLAPTVDEPSVLDSVAVLLGSVSEAAFALGR